MNKLFFSMLAVATLFGSCVKDDNDKNSGGNSKDLITPEIANMAVSSTKSFSGALTVLPCVENTSTYYGNYNDDGSLTVFHPNYIILNGLVTKSPVVVRLPAGDYNFVYWGVPINSQADSTYDDVAIGEPPLTLGTDLKQLSYTLRKESPSDTTYMPVYDFVFAVQPLLVGTDKMQATLDRVVAGLKVTLTNHDGLTMNSSIASAQIHIGSIAGSLNYYTSAPSDFTKTVAFPLTMSADSLSMSANSTVMVFPSGNAPLLTIILQLKNGQQKIYSKPLSSPLSAGNRLTLTITLGELLIEEGSSDDFEVENWTETSETINFPS